MPNPSVAAVMNRLAVQREVAARFVYSVLDQSPSGSWPREELIRDAETVSTRYRLAFNALTTEEQSGLPHQWSVTTIASRYVNSVVLLGGEKAWIPSHGQLLEIMRESIAAAEADGFIAQPA